MMKKPIHFKTDKNLYIYINKQFEKGEAYTPATNFFLRCLPINLENFFTLKFGNLYLQFMSNEIPHFISANFRQTKTAQKKREN